MPKIKFSALVSGMSGKANGSVFATNNAGSYFRTNGSKLKPNTAKNSIRKSEFSQVAQAWRALTSEQQQAWKDSVSNFVVQNSFGDNRTPTGYEVFTRLNNTKLRDGQTLLSLPPMPRSLPAIGAVELEVLDLTQYIPTLGMVNFNKNAITSPVTYVNTGYPATGDMLNNQTYLIGFDLSQYTQPLTTFQEDIGVYEVLGTSGNNMAINIRPNGSGFANVFFSCSGGSGTISAITNDSRIDLSKPNTIAVFVSNGNIDDVQFYVNGRKCTKSTTPSGSWSMPEADGGLILGKSVTLSNPRYSIFDVRYWDTVQTEQNLRYATLGYILGTEKAIFNFENYITGTGIIDFLENVPSHYTSNPILTNAQLQVHVDSQRVPYLLLTCEGVGIESTALNIYASPPVSFGITGKQSNYRLLGSFPWDGINEFDVTEAWRQAFGAYPINSYINFQISVFDQSTGVVSSALSKPPKRKRFKAGAELSGAVN